MIRLALTEARELPAPAALVSSEGAVIAHTPEWRGPGAGAMVYRYGKSSVVLGAEASYPELDYLIAALLSEMRVAGSLKGGNAALKAEMLAASLELVAGRPVTAKGTLSDVLAYARAGVAARAQVELVPVGNWGAAPVEGPAVIALALVQLAVNAEKHARARRIEIEASHGPTFKLSWEDPLATGTSGGAVMETSRSVNRRKRWGMGYVRRVADALGGVVTDPRSPRPGVRAIGLGFGTGRLNLPIAVVEDGKITQYAPSWEEEMRWRQGDAMPEEAEEALSLAARSPGQIAVTDFMSARDTGRRAWVMLRPDTEPDRAKSVAIGIRHEAGLWGGTGVQALRIQALCSVLLRRLGTEWEGCPAMVWEEQFPAFCHQLGVPVPVPMKRFSYPSPYVAAYLLAELGGQLEETGDGVYFRPGPGNERHPLAVALSPSNGLVTLIRHA